MRTPLTLVILGALMFLTGFILGNNDVDPASAFVGTTGMAVAVVGLVWAVVGQLRTR